MDADGVEIRPLVDMTGAHAFNEVFLDEVRLPADHLVGEVGGGWELAKVTLANERVSLSGEGALWGAGPTAADLVELVRPGGGRADRRRCASAWSTPGSRGRSCGSCGCASVSAALAGRAPGSRGLGPQRPSPTPTASG